MTNGRKSGAWPSEWFLVPAALLTLVTLVVAQSVYELLQGNPEFLAVRLVRPGHLLEIVLAFNLLPALVLFLLWALCRAWRRGLARAVLAAAFFFFFLAFFLQIHNAQWGGAEPFRYAYLFWIIPSALLVLVSRRWEQAFLSSLATLSPVALILPALFLNHAWPSVPQAPRGEASPRAAVAAPARARSLPPIFILVFDEFTLPALLDESGQIDAARFPHFKKLAEESYWFRNATSNGSYTRQAIHAILTGNRVLSDDVSGAGPNLFSWLQPDYDIYIYDWHMQLCSPELFHCPQVERAAGARQLLRDVFVLYATRVLPAGLDLGLPDVRRTWGPFRAWREDVSARLRRYDQFLDSIGSAPRENVLFFFHHMLPHSPYVMRPDGRMDDSRVAYLAIQESMVGNRPILRDLRDRYLLQVGYVDTEVGRFLARLKELGLYDRSLLILTGDHGVSWVPEAPGRFLTRPNAGMILSVPLFLKVPGQKRGEVSDRDVQHIDLLPTVAEVLGLELPGKRSGRSVFTSQPEPRRKTAYDPRAGVLDFPDTLGLVRTPVVLEASRPASASPLIGQQTSAFELVPYAGRQAHVSPVTVLSGLAGNDSLVYVSGWIDARPPAAIAVAVNGKIVAVTSEFWEVQEGKPRMWNVSFSTRVLAPGENEVSVYALPEAGRRTLAPLPPGLNNIIRWKP